MFGVMELKCSTSAAMLSLNTLTTIVSLPQVKSGPFFEHSNTLYGISNVPTWSKVNSGLLKMYKAEVCL